MMVHVVGGNVVEDLFNTLSELYKEKKDWTNSLISFDNFGAFNWGLYMTETHYNANNLVYGVINNTKGDMHIGYCNPRGFWYLVDGQIHLVRWGSMLSKLSNYHLTVLIADSKYSQKKFDEFKNVISLATLTNIYQS